VKWRSSAPAIAKVDSRGRVTARRAGTATIVASSDGLEARAELTVTAAARKRAPLRPVVALAATAAAGLVIWAVVSQFDDDPRPAGAISAGTLATIPAPAVAPTATPTATPTARAPAPAAVAVPVAVPADTTIASIELADQSPMAMETGEVKLLIASAANRRGEPIPTVRIDWETSNPAVATVDVDGVLSAVAGGRTMVTARVGELTRVLAVDVRQATAARDSVQPADSTPASPSVVVEAGLPAGVRAPSESEARAIADSVVAMIGRRVVRVSQLVRADPEPGALFHQFLDSLTPTARLAGTPVVSDVQPTSARVAFGVVLEWEATPTMSRERTVNLESVLETVRGGWAIRELRFPNGFTTQPPR
jgi:hypothetical protein